MKQLVYRVDFHLADGTIKEHKVVGHRFEGALFLVKLDNGEIHFYPYDKVNKVVVHSEYTKAARERAMGPKLEIPKRVLVPGDGQHPR